MYDRYVTATERIAKVYGSGIARTHGEAMILAACDVCSQDVLDRICATSELAAGWRIGLP